MKKVVVHSDGGCHGNPGPGGWAAVLSAEGRRREISGAEAATTNNRMELQAAIEALSALKQPCEVQFFTDSLYVRKGVQSWMAVWKRNGWKTKGKLPVKNEDLWRALDECAAPHRISWNWVRGHAGDPENERCDELAASAIVRIKTELSVAELQARLQAFRQTVVPSTALQGSEDGLFVQRAG